VDRLSALTAIVVAVVATLAACDKGAGDQPPPPGRTNGAKVGSAQKASADAFCDVHHADDSGPLLQIPPVGEVKAIAKQGRWTWLNIWATWCKPCVEEMPMIVKWTSEKKFAGVELDALFVSVDENDADITAFKQAHADLPPTARLADPKVQPEWFKQLGLDAAPPIPIHVFVSPTGHIRCARAGSIAAKDAAAIEKLFHE